MKLSKLLSEMSPGEKGIVEKTEIDSRAATRLLEMGLLPGTPVHFLRCAPLGDPVEIELKGYLLALRKSDARKVTVIIDSTP